MQQYSVQWYAYVVLGQTLIWHSADSKPITTSMTSKLISVSFFSNVALRRTHRVCMEREEGEGGGIQITYCAHEEELGVVTVLVSPAGH